MHEEYITEKLGFTRVEEISYITLLFSDVLIRNTCDMYFRAEQHGKTCFLAAVFCDNKSKIYLIENKRTLYFLSTYCYGRNSVFLSIGGH